ncbi:MAG: hypothetical protein ACK46X_06960 [Candidatus Sericytochromatia bacterium]
MFLRSACLLVAMGLILTGGCQASGLAPVTRDGGGGGGGFTTPLPDPTLGGTIVAPTPPVTTPDPAGFPVTLPPVQGSTPPFQPPLASPGAATPAPAGGAGGGVTASPGTSPAPFPAISPPPTPGVGTAGGA